MFFFLKTQDQTFPGALRAPEKILRQTIIFLDFFIFSIPIFSEIFKIFPKNLKFHPISALSEIPGSKILIPGLNKKRVSEFPNDPGHSGSLWLEKNKPLSALREKITLRGQLCESPALCVPNFRLLLTYMWLALKNTLQNR